MGEIIHYRFRCWVRHLLCTDLQAADGFACHVPTGLDGDLSESGLLSLPIDWVRLTFAEVEYSILIPSKPAFLVIGAPGHQSLVDTPAAMHPNVALQLTASAFSGRVRAAPEDYKLCYAVSHAHAEGIVERLQLNHEGEVPRSLLVRGLFDDGGSESRFREPRCVALSEGAPLEPFALTHDLGGSDKQHRIEVWVQPTPPVNAASAHYWSPPRFLSVTHVFFSRAAPLPCAGFDQNARALNRSLAAAYDVHVYENNTHQHSRCPDDDTLNKASQFSGNKLPPHNCRGNGAVSPSQVRELVLTTFETTLKE